MTIDTSTLGAPVTDIDDFIASRPGSPCHADALARPDIIDESDDAQRSRLRWAAVPIVIAALVAAWMLGAAGTPDPTLPSPPTTPDGLEGFAELYVATFLTEAGIDATDALDPFAIPIDGIEAMTPYERYVPRSAAIRIDPIGVDYWAVLVAADVLYRTEGGYGPGGVEYFEVAIAATDGGFVATAAPLPVRRPAAVIPYGTYGELRAEADEATVAFMADFLEAYFTDSGRLPRMVTADSGIEAAAPFAAVEMGSVRVGEIDAATWVTASAIVTNHEGIRLPTSVTVRLVGDSAGPRIAELLPGAPAASTVTADG